MPFNAKSDDALMQRVLSRLDDIEGKVDRCLMQVTATNGRVSKLEQLRWFAVGAVATITTIVSIWAALSRR